MKGRIRVVLAVAGAAWLAPRGARAGDDLADCVTHTARPASEIVVPLTDRAPSPAGISIVAGETLCLAGAVQERGFLVPRLADAARGEPVLVRMHLETSARGTVFETRTSSARWLRYRAAVVSGPANLAFPTSTLPVSPGGQSFEHWDASVSRLLLHGLQLFDPPPQISVVAASIAERGGRIGIDQAGVGGLVGVRRLSVGTFDAPLRASGYDPLPRTFLGGGFDIGFVFSRWRFEWPLFFGSAGAFNPRDGSHVDAGIADIHIDAGYDFLRWRGLTGFALGGIGVSSFTIDARGAHWSYVTERASGLGDANRIKLESGVLSAQVGFEQLVPLGKASANEMFALMLSIRGGYLAQFAQEGWRTDDDSRSVGGLPSVDLGGAWLSLNVGLGAYSITWRTVRHE